MIELCLLLLVLLKTLEFAFHICDRPAPVPLKPLHRSPGQSYLDELTELSEHLPDPYAQCPRCGKYPNE